MSGRKPALDLLEPRPHTRYLTLRDPMGQNLTGRRGPNHQVENLEKLVEQERDRIRERKRHKIHLQRELRGH
jgi:hypothetical protein